MLKLAFPSSSASAGCKQFTGGEPDQTLTCTIRTRVQASSRAATLYDKMPTAMDVSLHAVCIACVRTVCFDIVLYKNTLFA